MTEYSNGNLDFIQRTLDILERNKDEKYNVTLLINCCIGLLVVPKEAFFDNIKTMALSQFNIDTAHLTAKNKDKNLQSIVRRMRNGITHFHLDFESRDNEINKITIKDRPSPDREFDFEITFEIKELKDFLLSLTSYLIKHHT
ncbi:HEPN family nuclease [Orbus hercynius]|uniref:HEPN family nuclease n=1 Tax=Orbus hercynius TaxID=593135 RepID=UPI0011C49FAE|nr:HEPN family nuclease [Orbus hercynius]